MLFHFGNATRDQDNPGIERCRSTFATLLDRRARRQVERGPLVGGGIVEALAVHIAGSPNISILEQRNR